MKYKCIKSARGLTKGKEYRESMPHPCSYNAAVRNDFGEVVFMPRKVFF